MLLSRFCAERFVGIRFLLKTEGTCDRVGKYHMIISKLSEEKKNEVLESFKKCPAIINY